MKVCLPPLQKNISRYSKCKKILMITQKATNGRDTEVEVVTKDFRTTIINILYIGGKVEKSLGITRKVTVFKIPSQTCKDNSLVSE